MGNNEKKDTVEEALKIFNNNWNHQIILYGPPGTSKTYSSSIIAASFLNDEKIDDYKKARDYLKDDVKEQYQIVQFHPSYNYDDFVRGIKMSITPEGNPRYDVVNKIFGEFVEKANNDYWMHQLVLKLEAGAQGNNSVKLEDLEKDIEYRQEALNIIKKMTTKVSTKCDEIKKLIDESKITEVSTKCDKIKKLINESKITEISTKLDEIKKLLNNLYEKTCEIIIDALYEKCSKIQNKNDIIKKLNQKSRYVLVIDEINRAPLASVLGELIYGLEYRDQPISTSYKLENGSEKIVIPDNLYIIGTMNTADRSIGTIDYAVRRRFAFIPVLPDWEVVNKSWNKSGLDIGDQNGGFIHDLEELWNKLKPKCKKNTDDNSSNGENSNGTIEYNSDIEVSDVQIGHTYFVYNEDKCKDLASAKAYINYRLEYEIKPILHEYRNDEIILNSKENKEKIESLKFEFREPVKKSL